MKGMVINMVKKKITVLVVDDSVVFRETIIQGLSADENIEVVAKATDAFEARDKILRFHPDVMLCDVEMPRMNGIEFIKRLLPQYSLPVIVVSGVSDSVFDAMDAGAVDFVAKPGTKSASSISMFIQELIIKVKIAAGSKAGVVFETGKSLPPIKKEFAAEKLIAIGASTGGTEAISNVLLKLPETVPGIVIVQHIPPVFSCMFAERMDSQTALRVKEAENGDLVSKGSVLIAPGDKHMRIKKIGNQYKAEVFSDEKVNGHCPSVDVLFDSVAKHAGSDAVGIILTGMGYDGAKGLLSMRRKGARTIGQDQKSCVVYGMPKVAYDIGAVEKQVPLDLVPQTLFSMLAD
ncbi:MAG: two-component system, chemotaxis family, protein-glutamate methylesterase/glutaminase [Clostridiales bacterium]|nr:two-component system, chemotaxis family, protein-glutamate methylesterase/glutaminase [Clostridiales bacterium]